MTGYATAGASFPVGRPPHCDQCEVRHLAVCSALDDDEVYRMDQIVSHRHFDPGQVLFEEGEEAGHVFNVSAGTLRLYKLLPDGRRQVTGFLFPGDFLGLSTGGTYAYGAEAVTPVMVCQFKTGELQSMFEEFPKMRARMLEIASDELSAAQEQILLLGRKTPIEKLASFLLGLSAKNAKWHRPPNPVDLSMNRSDIADYLGLTIETVSRTFTRMRNDGVIDLPESSHVVITNMELLKELAEEA